MLSFEVFAIEECNKHVRLEIDIAAKLIGSYHVECSKASMSISISTALFLRLRATLCPLQLQP